MLLIVIVVGFSWLARGCRPDDASELFSWIDGVEEGICITVHVERHTLRHSFFS